MFDTSLPPPRRAVACSRRSLLSLPLLAALPLPALAADTDTGPTAPIRALYVGLESLMREGKTTPFAKRFQQIAPVITQAFDLTAILARSVGLQWSGLSQPLRDGLFKAFTDFTIASYVANFNQYDGQKFQVLPQTRSVGADRIVASRIIRTNGSPVTIDYVMRQSGPDWKIVDVLLDGTISRVAVQRSDFRSILDHGGAPALITSLQRKTADLSGGSQLSSAAPKP